MMMIIREIYAAADTDNVRSLIEKHFIPSADEKKKNAEVPTPVALVDEMLDAVPTEFWETPKKVFEPCCGKGNFVLGIFDRFFEGLAAAIPNPIERCRAIVEDCLYYADLTAMNVFITTEIFKCHALAKGGAEGADYVFRAHTGDTLALDPLTVWGVEKFDAVVGNPPYNKSKESALKGGYGGRSLWDKFVIDALDRLLIKGGYLLYVHPPSWRKPDHYLWKILSRKQIVYLKAYSEKEGQQLFNCSTMVDFYLLENTIVYKDTVFYGQDKNTYSINLEEMHFLPSGCIDIIKSILGDSVVLYSSAIYDTRKKYISVEPTSLHTLPIIHSMTAKNGLGLVYSKENRGHVGVSKVVLSFGRHQYPYNDWEGKYGMSQICYGLEIDSKEEGDNIVHAINSDRFKEILKYTKWSTFQTDWRMFKEFRKDFWKEFV